MCIYIGLQHTCNTFFAIITTVPPRTVKDVFVKTVPPRMAQCGIKHATRDGAMWHQTCHQGWHQENQALRANAFPAGITAEPARCNAGLTGMRPFAVHRTCQMILATASLNGCC